MMPVENVGGGHRYGQSGKLYKGPGSKAKAERQGRAVQVSKARQRKKKKALLEACRACKRTPYLKLGARLDGQKLQFEAAFANLASAVLQENAAPLMDYLLGFQLLEKSEDNDRAVGIFGFKIGEQLIYVPVFFLEGELKGGDFIYLVDTDMFVPLDEQWVNYLLNRRPLEVGSSAGKSLTDRGIYQPGFEVFRGDTELTTKTGVVIEPWLAAGLPGLIAATRRFTPLKSAVPKLVEKSAKSAIDLLKIVDAWPKIAKTLENYYGEGFLAKTLESAKTKNTIMPAAPKRIRKAARVEPNSSLQLFTNSNSSKLSVEEKLELRRNGYFIKDSREDASVAYVIHEPITLRSPDETGLYDLFTRPDNFEQCLVVRNPVMEDSRAPSCLVIRVDGNGKNKAWLYAPASELYISDKSFDEDYKDWLDDLPEAGSLAKEGLYMLLSPDGKSGTGVFEVRRALPASGNEKCYQIWWKNTYSAYEDGRVRHIMPLSKELDLAYGDENTVGDEPQIIIGRRNSRRFSRMGGTVLAPEGAKVVSLKDWDQEVAPGPAAVESQKEPKEYDPAPLRPGRQSDLYLGIIKNSTAIKVSVDGPHVAINGEPMLEKQAVWNLVYDHGLRESDAKMLIGKVKTGSYRFRIKYAQNYPLQQSNTSMAWPSDPQPSADFVFGSSMPVGVSEEQAYPVPGMDALTEPPLPETYPIEPQTMQSSLGQAAQTGQQEVFDTQLLGSLLNRSREDSIIDEYLPNLVQGLDAIGRLRFNIYWHRDKFAERYGDRKVIELEDALTGAFQQLGDLTMSLKKREVAPRPEKGLDIDLQSLLG